MKINTISQKKNIRTYMRTLRNSLSFSQQYIAAQLITNKIISLNQIIQATNIAIFISIDGEIRTDLLIKSLLFMQKYIYLPIISSEKSQYLSFIQYNLSSELIRNPRNKTYEPRHNATAIFSIKMLDIMFVPLVAFDNNGNRLGMGGGYYDKTLQYWKKKTDCIFIGIGYDFQKIPASILPIEEWDEKLPQIITPSYHYKKLNFTSSIL